MIMLLFSGTEVQLEVQDSCRDRSVFLLQVSWYQIVICHWKTMLISVRFLKERSAIGARVPPVHRGHSSDLHRQKRIPSGRRSSLSLEYTWWCIDFCREMAVKSAASAGWWTIIDTRLTSIIDRDDLPAWGGAADCEWGGQWIELKEWILQELLIYEMTSSAVWQTRA